ncbi:hypothetical protein LZZ85_18575 [Terrimonas sp. NA20]|uniref:DUF1080 domain-containing protein n=1 Tax=Terrimonas ginsenosidimutans TaxID=2908004 RepID=A0ABS9KVF5_9BACT|nr:hypothetical protein [Terrimonas ginsenosidimutans]MCG2616311.1 hypothetical protein [Terrimonas ginsenosidimutans]
MNKTPTIITVLALALAGCNQKFSWQGGAWQPINVKATVVDSGSEQILKVERDLKALPFDTARLAATVDQPTYVKWLAHDVSAGVIEVKVFSRIKPDSPFKQARGFIGLVFYIGEDDKAFESVYLRPSNGRSTDSAMRSHAVQYFAYPDHKFDRLRREAPGIYESGADIGLNEWISLRLEITKYARRLYINEGKIPVLSVMEPRGTQSYGAIGLWVDIGTEGYFKEFRFIPAK